MPGMVLSNKLTFLNYDTYAAGTAFVIRMNSDLDEINWIGTVATNGDSWQVGAVADSDNNVFLAYGQKLDGNDVSRKQSYVYVTQFNEEGQEQWTKEYEDGAFNYVVSVGITVDDNLILTTESYDDNDKMHGWIGLIDGTGTVTWDHTYENEEGSLYFNADPSDDGSYLIVSGEEVSNECYIGTILRYLLSD